MSPMTLDSLSPTDSTDRTIGSPSLSVRVVNAMDGVLHEIHVTARSSVNTLRQELVLKTGIPCDDQILLYGPPYARLDPKKSVESYQLDPNSKSIFVYDRRVLSQDNPQVPRVVLHPQTVEMPPVPTTSSSSRLLQDTSSPLLRALFDYETQFHQQYLMGEALENATMARLASADTCLEELRAQGAGVQAALSNLETHHSAMQKRFTPFWKEFQAATDDHAQLLANFGTYVDRLKDIPLHPALATPTRTTLLDCIPLERERDWLLSCQQSHNSLQTKMEGLAATYRGVSDTIASSQQNAPVAVPSDLLMQKVALAAKASSLSTMRKTLKDNYEAVSKRVAETTQQTMEEAGSISSASMNMSFMFGSTHILEACRGLDDLFRQHADVLPAMQKIDEEVKAFMNSVAEAKEKYFPVVFAQLKLVSTLQSNIVDFESHLSILRDALAFQKRQFAELKHIEMLPEAYEACLVEIKRRRKYGRLFQLRINEMGEKIVEMRNDEITKREAFLREYGRHLPRDFAPGLTEKPSHCNVSMRPFDTNLPAIEDDSVDDPPSELELLKQRCQALEAQVVELRAELDEQKKVSCHCDDGYSNSSSLSASVEQTQGPKFPLLLALAATAGHNTMRNSSEILKDNDEVQRLKETLYAKESRVTELESEHEALNETVHTLQFNMGMQRNWLKKIVTVLELGDVDLESAEGLHECLMQIEDKWKESKAVAEHSEPSPSLSWEEERQSTIAFRSFSYNDLALFLPTFAPNDTNAAKIYLAFHLGCPNRFLSDESITTFYQTQNRYPEYILGRIVFIDERVASERDNPYRLITGTTFYVLTVTAEY
ncbi:hypothetical protein LEN26_015023 [Aphanomyces euteiches]|nr:hypothetical protein LEN26_015023 [Aphanomyces euteiches]KAH9123719.1 hypothetical protein AeMF1_005380 [Aphanomyces euteiches]